MDYLGKIIAVCVSGLLVPVIISIRKLVVAYLEAKADQVLQRTKQEADSYDISQAERLVNDVINYVAMTMVDNLRSKGTFNSEAQALAKEKAIETVQDLIPDEVECVIEQCFGDFQKWVEVKMESLLYQSKLDSADIAAVGPVSDDIVTMDDDYCEEYEDFGD